MKITNSKSLTTAKSLNNTDNLIKIFIITLILIALLGCSLQSNETITDYETEVGVINQSLTICPIKAPVPITKPYICEYRQTGSDPYLPEPYSIRYDREPGFKHYHCQPKCSCIMYLDAQIDYSNGFDDLCSPDFAPEKTDYNIKCREEIARDAMNFHAISSTVRADSKEEAIRICNETYPTLAIYEGECAKVCYREFEQYGQYNEEGEFYHSDSYRVQYPCCQSKEPVLDEGAKMKTKNNMEFDLNEPLERR